MKKLFRWVCTFGALMGLSVWTAGAATGGGSGAVTGTAKVVPPLGVTQGGTNLFSIGTNLNNNTPEQIVRGYRYGRQIGAQNSAGMEQPQRTFDTAYFPFLGGDVSGANGLPLRGGELWRNQPYPPFVYTTWFQMHQNPTENFLTNQIRSLFTNVVPWLALFGVKPIIEQDAGWHYTNANPLLSNRDVNERLWWNTNAFADGFPFIINYGHTNGCLFGLHQYYDTADPSTYESTVGAGAYQVMTTPRLVEWDVLQFYDWGIDLLLVADVSQAGYYRQLVNQFGNAVIHPNSYPLREGSNGIAGGIYSLATYSNRMSLMMLDAGPPHLDEIAYSLNGIFCDNPVPGGGNGDPISEEMGQARANYTNAARLTSKGHYFSTQAVHDNSSVLASARAMYTMGAMFCAPFDWGYNVVPTTATQQAFTNVDMLGIYFDQLQMPAVRVYDLGKSNISCWIKPLFGGDYALVLANESGASQSLGVSFGQLNSSNSYYPPLGATISSFRVDTNGVYNLYDVWTRSYVGLVSGTVTQTVAANSLKLYRLTPFNPGLPTTGGGVVSIMSYSNQIQSLGASASLVIGNRDNSALTETFFGAGNVFGILDASLPGYWLQINQISPYDITIGNGSGGALLFKHKTSIKTSNYSVVVADMGTWFNNSGAVAAQTNTLPAAAAGLHYGQYVDAAQFVCFRAVGSDTIRNAASVSTGAGGLFANTVGNSVHLVCHVAGKWSVESIMGSWTTF